METEKRFGCSMDAIDSSIFIDLGSKGNNIRGSTEIDETPGFKDGSLLYKRMDF